MKDLDTAKIERYIKDDFKILVGKKKGGNGVNVGEIEDLSEEVANKYDASLLFPLLVNELRDNDMEDGKDNRYCAIEILGYLYRILNYNMEEFKVDHTDLIRKIKSELERARDKDRDHFVKSEARRLLA